MIFLWKPDLKDGLSSNNSVLETPNSWGLPDGHSCWWIFFMGGPIASSKFIIMKTTINGWKILYRDTHCKWLERDKSDKWDKQITADRQTQNENHQNGWNPKPFVGPLVAHTRRIMPLSNFFTTMVAKSPQLDCPICNWVLTPCHGTYPPFLVLHIPMAGYNFICWRIFLGQIPIVVGQILVSTTKSLSRQMPFPSHKFLLLGCFQRRHFDLNNPILQSNPPNHVDFSHLFPF